MCRKLLFHFDETYGSITLTLSMYHQKEFFRRRLWKKIKHRPRLGGKTPPSPGRRVPVDSPEDRRFSNRSK